MPTRRLISVVSILLLAAVVAMSGCSRGSWRESSRDSAGIAPLPHEESQAVIQVYGAAVWGWRGWFADHTWISTKAADADSYTVYEVIGWRLRRTGTALRIAQDVPDRRWFGSEPKVLLDLRGEKAAALVDKVDSAARAYPYPDAYNAFPGPNSNTFIAWVAAEVPELGLVLPARAIGKSYPFDVGR